MGVWRRLLEVLLGESGLGRISVGAAMVIALGAGLGGYYVVQQQQGGSDTANLWVDTNGGSCTRTGGAGASYVDADACGSMNAAYAAASGGDTIKVRCGTYGSQSIANRSIGSSIVTIEKDPDDNGCSRVTTGDLSIATSYITVSGVQGTGDGNPNFTSFSIGLYSQECDQNYPDGNWPCPMPRNYVTLDNFHYNTGTSSGTGYLTLSNGEIGPLKVDQPGGCLGEVDGFNTTGLGPHNLGSGNYDHSTAVGTPHLTIDNVYVHDITNDTFPTPCDAHVDGIQGNTGYDHWLIENSYFSNDNTCVLAYAWANPSLNPYQVDTITIRNTVFASNGAGDHCITLGNDGTDPCGDSNANNVIENNTWLSGLVADVRCGSGGGSYDAIFRNNIVLPSLACGVGGATDFDLSYNDFDTGNATCQASSGAVTCTPTFTSGFDLSSSDTCVKNLIPPANPHPATDYYGTSRPQGTNVDAGAYEVPGG